MKTLLRLSVLMCALSAFSCKKSNPAPAPTISPTIFVGYFCNPSLNNILNVKENGQFIVGIGPKGDPNYMDVARMGNTLKIDFLMSAHGQTPDTLFASFSEQLATGSHYSVFFGGRQDSACKIFMEDNYPAVDSGKVALRFVDMSSDTASFDCYLDTAKLFTNLRYTGFSPFYQVSLKNSSTVHFYPSGSASGGISLDSLRMLPSFVYSVVLCGNATYTVQKIAQTFPKPVL